MSAHSTSGFVPAMAAVGFSFLLVSGVSLEFDRMTGTAFPAQQTINGQPLSLAAIYNDAGIHLDVQEEQWKGSG